MLKKYSLKALQKAINHAMSLDEKMAVQINALEDKVLEMIIAPLNVHFYMRFDEGKIELLDQCVEKPDTIIRSNPIGLIRLSLLPASQARSLFNDNVKIEGDLETGRAIKNLFDQLDIDWEGHLALFTGDVVAHQIGSIFRKGRAYKKQLSNSMRQNITEYIQEECRLLPTPGEINDLFNDIDELVLDVERIQAHIQQLMGSHELH